MKKSVFLSIILCAVICFSACTAGNASSDTTFTLYVQGKIWKEITFEKGDSVSLPTPSPDGYTFLGWYCDADLKVPFIEQLTYEEGGTLYAMLLADAVLP